MSKFVQDDREYGEESDQQGLIPVVESKGACHILKIFYLYGSEQDKQENKGCNMDVILITCLGYFSFSGRDDSSFLLKATPPARA